MLGDQALEQGLEVADTTRLVLHRGDRHRRPGGEHRDQSSPDARGSDHALDSLSHVDDLAVAGRVHASEAPVDGHGQTILTRANRRLPSCRTRPSTALSSRSSEPSVSGWPSSLTPPWAIARRASDVETSNAWARSAGR